MRYQFEFNQSERLEKAMSNLPNETERLVNEKLHESGTKEVIKNIVGFIPVSSKNKKHAKTSNPLKELTFNLGFEVYAKGGAANAKGSFGYLVFPNEGRGPRNNVAQSFFERGAEKSNARILDDVIEVLEKAHEKIM